MAERVSPDSLPLLKFRSSKVVHEPQGTFWTSVFALLGTMLGAGALSLPSTMSMAGVVPDVLIFLFMAVFNFAALNAATTAAAYTGKASYESMAAQLFGPVRQWMIRGLTIALLFGAQCMFLVVSLDMLEPFVATYVNRQVLGAFLTLLTLPFCLLETIYALRYTNIIVIGCMIYIFVVVGIRSVTSGGWPNPPSSPTMHGIFKAIPMQALSFGCQINAVRVYDELKTKSIITAVNISTMGAGFIMYVGFAFAGYLCFHGFPPADILTGFPSDDWLVNSIRLVLGPCVLFKVPLMCHPYMQALEAMVMPKDIVEPKAFRTFLTVTSLAAAYLVAVTCKDLSVIMVFVGAFGDLSINFSAPGMFLMEVGYRTNSKSAIWMGGFLVVSGVIMIVVSV
ncbi:Solute carrier 38 member [Aphanomyces cochlioides]|nr:Solute carrier 38 member [Aphanomyces cochlioides]